MKSNKKFTKILSLALCAALCVSLLTACGSAYAETSAEEQEQADDEILSAASSLLTSHGDAQGKEQTVYVITDASGNPTKTIVSTWLKNPDGEDTIEDNASLSDIEVTKGEASYTADGDDITWDVAGSGIYYQGVSDEELPISVSISYKLDDKAIEPEELDGASGHLEMTFSYTNNTAATRKVDGKNVTLYQPFAVVSGAVFDQDVASNVEVEGGKVISTGDQFAVVGLAFPGLKESLDLDDDIADALSIPDEVTIEADVTDFSLLTTMTIVDNSVFQSLDLDDVSTLDDLEASINELSSASSQLVDGSNTLESGTATFSEKMTEFNTGIAEVNSGAKTLQEGASYLASQVNGLPNEVNSLYSGANTIKEKLSELQAGAQQVSGGITDVNTALVGIQDGANTLATATSVDTITAAADSLNTKLKTYSDGIGGISGNLSIISSNNSDALTQLKNIQASLEEGSPARTAVDAAIDSLTANTTTIQTAQTAAGTTVPDISAELTGIAAISNFTTSLKTIAGTAETASQATKEGGKLQAGASTVASGLSLVNENYGQIVSGLDTLSTSSSALVEGIKSLSTGSQDLVNGTSQLSEGSAALVSGAQALLDGAQQLRSGMAQFDSDGIVKLSSLFQDDAEGLIDRLKALQEYSEEYTEFSGNSGMDSSVRFIFRTDSIGE